MKTAKRAAEKKSPGTLTVEKHRPLVNKLTLAQRRWLRQRAAELLYGREARTVSIKCN